MQAAEILALDILRAADGRPVTLEMVQRRFAALAGHRCGCGCWRCQAAKRVGVNRVWRILEAWQRNYR